MKRIYKYLTGKPMEAGKEFILPLPKGWGFMCADIQKEHFALGQIDEPSLWLLVDPEDKELSDNVFKWVWTGQDVDDVEWDYLTTMQHKGFVWHLFYKRWTRK